jgi:hypothetical protein
MRSKTELLKILFAWRHVKYVLYSYLLLLLLGTVLPINTKDSPSLNDNYTLTIRWDYWLHALVYIPVPVLLGLSMRRRYAGKEDAQQQIKRKHQPQINREHPVRNNVNHQAQRRDYEYRLTVKPCFWLQLAGYSFFITAAYEGLQLVIPFRAFNINDLVANGVGAVLGYLLLVVFRKHFTLEGIKPMKRTGY